MAKFVNDTNLDQALNYLKNNGTVINICAGQPANYNEAITNFGSTVPGGGTARRLGGSAIASTDYTGPANGDTSGRKITVNQVTSVSIEVTATANHVAIVSSSTASALLLVTTVTGQTVTTGNTATINAFDQEILDAS